MIASPDPALDLPEGDDDLLGHVVRLEILVGQVLDRITTAHGISAADYLVLGVIRRSPEQRSAPTAICDVLGRTTGGMSLTLDRLERAGWIRRLPDPSDRRRIVVEATDAGLALATSVNADLHGWESALGVDAVERVSLAGSLARLTHLIEAHPHP
ncbi:MarR family winged helix-turn-helix transcriptional regulator [Rhabdothermincola salaria]|uniref:MarR family winged helix-turn-helix transcriptional regulator n=1 Tax=Rhabdothermincola salaria TaxID=2903142 RepID=UPI001E312308|nr:MarR family transcriptional regulator [Rhabdothermincola salaria]